MDIERIKRIAYGFFGTKRLNPDREPGNSYHHGDRVGTLCVNLRKRVMPDDAGKDDLLYVAGLFHDCGKGTDPHHMTGAKNTEKLLRNECNKNNSLVRGYRAKRGNQPCTRTVRARPGCKAGYGAPHRNPVLKG